MDEGRCGEFCSLGGGMVGGWWEGMVMGRGMVGRRMM